VLGRLTFGGPWALGLKPIKCFHLHAALKGRSSTSGSHHPQSTRDKHREGRFPIRSLSGHWQTNGLARRRRTPRCIKDFRYRDIRFQ
jgi:hypothetical protein